MCGEKIKEVVEMAEQNRTKIGLSSEQLNAAEMLANPSYKGSKSKIITEVGVSRSTFYNWFKNSCFTEYVNELIDKYTDAELSSVWKALLTRCRGGDVQAIKLYFELKGKYKQSVDVENSGTIQIVIDKGADDYAG